MLSVRNLALKKGQKKTEILRDICLEIPKGRITLLLGKSGSGKTTLMRCLAQLERDYEGVVSYDGSCVSKLSARERCGLLGFVPQGYVLFPHMNVLENCAGPLRLDPKQKKEKVYEAVERMLADLDMGKFLLAKPHELSGGQQQRVVIARALLLNPAFLLLDEPTSALDPENTELLVKIVGKLREEGKGLVISSQDTGFVTKVLDRAYVLEEGAFVESYEGQGQVPERVKRFCAN